jgi:carboxymethylenebutenolidase
MTVLKGEGRNVILYGSTAVPVGRTLPAYIARPGIAGAHPVVAIAHDVDGLTSSVKALCRRIARYGLGVVCPDLYRGGEAGGEIDPVRAASDLEAGFDFAVGTGWGSTGGAAVVGIGAGGAAVIRSIPTFVERVIVVGTPLGSSDDPDAPAAFLATVTAPLLGLYGADDERAPAGDVRAAGGATGEWVIYPGAARAFHDEASDAYEPVAAEDAIRRMLEFLGAT